MTFLVLGSSGQIGAQLTKHLQQHGHQVVEWDIANNPQQDLRIYNHELLDIMNNCDFVFYLASDVGGAKYLEQHQESYSFINNNLEIMCNTFKMLNFCNKPFIFTSSQMAELTHSTYGQLKLIGEKMTNSIGGLVVRMWNVYGQEKDIEKSHVITDFIRMAKTKNKITMKTDGKESRQFLYAEDCANCLLTLATQYDTLNKSKNYHITNFKWTTIFEIAQIVSKLANCEIEIGIKKDKTQMNAMNSADNYILNFWKPTTSLEDGIKIIYNRS
jgi:nucleoside-diphosphate-sugar epimerase